MLGRARMLNAQGFAVLLFDFQAHGESPGRYLTFGYLELRDARAAFDFMRQRLPGEHIGVVGMSLGGAAAILSEKPLELTPDGARSRIWLIRRGARQPDGDATRVPGAMAVAAA